MDLSGHFTGSHGTMYYVRDMKKSVAMYTEKFGIKPAYATNFWTEFDIKGTKLCLHLADDSMKTLPGGIMILNVKGMTKLVDGLKTAGVKFKGEPHLVHGEEYTVDFYDLDQNLISLYGTLK